MKIDKKSMTMVAVRGKNRHYLLNWIFILALLLPLHPICSLQVPTFASTGLIPYERLNSVREALVDAIGVLGTHNESGGEEIPQLPSIILESIMQEANRFEEGDDEEEEEEDPGIRTFTITAERVLNVKNHQGDSFLFRPTSNSTITEAVLWVHINEKRQHHNKGVLKIYLIDQYTSRTTLVARRKTQHGRGMGWYSVQLTNMTRLLAKDTVKEHLFLRIICKRCELGSDPPYLILSHLPDAYLPMHPTRRRKQGVRCTDTSTECCLDDLTVSVRDLVSTPGSVHPPNINIGQCRGSCSNAHTSLNLYASFMQMSDADGSSGVQTSRCCVPKFRKSKTLLVYGQQGDVSVHTIRRLVVSACGCV